jgi:hypothetical protein
VIGEHLVITCLSKHFEATTPDSELKPTTCVESWLVSAERRDNLVDGYDSRETDSEAKHNFAEAAKSLELLSRVQPKNAHIFDLLPDAYSGSSKKTQAEQAKARRKLLNSNK